MIVVSACLEENIQLPCLSIWKLLDIGVHTIKKNDFVLKIVISNRLKIIAVRTGKSPELDIEYCEDKMMEANASCQNKSQKMGKIPIFTKYLLCAGHLYEIETRTKERLLGCENWGKRFIENVIKRKVF